MATIFLRGLPMAHTVRPCQVNSAWRVCCCRVQFPVAFKRLESVALSQTKSSVRATNKQVHISIDMQHTAQCYNRLCRAPAACKEVSARGSGRERRRYGRCFVTTSALSVTTTDLLIATTSLWCLPLLLLVRASVL